MEVFQCPCEYWSFEHFYRVLHSGGPDGEIGASLRYLSQRFTMPNRMATAVLNDIGTEELAHLGYQWFR